MFLYQNAGQNYDTLFANKSFENAVKFKYFGMTVTSQNYIQKEIKSRLNSGNACYYSVHVLFSSGLLSKI
jgi:hypothetical protein